MLKSAEMYSLPLRRQNRDHLPTDANVQNSLGEWYTDLSNHSRAAISALDSVRLCSTAVSPQLEDYNPQHLYPALATRSARTPAEGSTSARHAVVARRRYQVITTECNFLPQETLSQEAVSPGKPYFQALDYGRTTKSPACQKTAVPSAAVVAGSHSAVKTHFVALPSSPRLNSSFYTCSQLLEQPMGQTASGRKSTENRKNDESLMTSSNDLSNTDDGCSTQAKMTKQTESLSNKKPRPCVNQARETQREGRRLLSFSMEEPLLQQSAQRVKTPMARRFYLADFCDLVHPSRPMTSTGRGGSQRNHLNGSLNQEFPVYHDRLSGVKSYQKKPIATPSCVQSSLHSAHVHQSVIRNSAHKPLLPTTTMAAAPATARTGLTYEQGDGCILSNAEASSMANGSLSAVLSSRKPSFSFVSCRPLVCQFVQRWRNRYEESKSAYFEGGYMTVTPGKKLNSRYVVVHKLGWGEFSTVWLAYDTLHKTAGKSHQPFVALKIAKCDSSVSASTQYEINLLRYIGMQASSSAPLTGLVDRFEVMGQYGSHMCMVMPLHGSNLLSIIDQMKAKKGVRNAQEIRLIKEIVASILLGLQELDKLDIIHTDIKPENILFSSPDPKVLDVIETFCRRNKERSTMVPFETLQDSVLKGDPNHLVCIADFGLSVALKPSNNAAGISSRSKPCQALLNSLIGSKKEFIVEKPGIVTNLRGTMIQTREYRAPETIIGLDFNTRTDLWSVGCMVFELITGDFLLDPKRRTKNERMMDVEHLAMIMQLLGPVPDEIVQLYTEKSSRRPPPRYIHRYFNEHGSFIYADKYRFYQKRYLDRELEVFLPPAEAKGAAAFIMRCLSSYDPAKRPSATELFADEWLLEVMGQ